MLEDMVCRKTFLLNQVVIAFVFVVAILQQAEGYNEDNLPMKWSPRYLYGDSGLLSKTPNAFYTPRTSRFDHFYGVPRGVGHIEGSLGSRNPGFYSRAVRGVKRSTCVSDGETCLYRSALAGAVIKLPCCKGSFCAYKGNRFVCMERDSLGDDGRDDFEDYNNPDENINY